MRPRGHLPPNSQNMKHALTQIWKLLFCEELEDHCNAHLHRIGNHFNMICWWTFSCPNLPISWHSKHRANILYRFQFCNHPTYIVPLSSFPTTRVLLSSSSFDMAILFQGQQKLLSYCMVDKFGKALTILQTVAKVQQQKYPLLSIHFQEPLRNNFSGHIDRDDCFWSFVWSHRKRSKQGRKDACGRLSQEVECDVPSVVNFYLNLEFFLFC